MPKIGEKMSREWGVNANHSFFDKHGLWYHAFERFPGALFDTHGYVMFETREAFDASPFINVNYGTNSVHVRAPGISAIPGYVRIRSGETA